MIWITLVACSSDITMVDMCHEAGSLMACETPVDHESAKIMCDNHQMFLAETRLDPDDVDSEYASQVYSVGNAFTEPWWSGLTVYECTLHFASDADTGTYAPADCSTAHPYICEP